MINCKENAFESATLFLAHSQNAFTGGWKENELAEFAKDSLRTKSRYI